MMIILMGKSGSGKNYIESKLVEMGYNRVISTTSRPMRKGEKECIDYKYVTKDTFLKMIDNDELIEYRTYNTLVDGIPDVWYYGLTKQSFDDDKKYVLILDVNGTNEFIKCVGRDKCSVTYIECDDEVREERAVARGGFNRVEWERRLKTDAEDFSFDKLLPIVDNFIINTNNHIDNIIEEITYEESI